MAANRLRRACGTGRALLSKDRHLVKSGGARRMRAIVSWQDRRQGACRISRDGRSV